MRVGKLPESQLNETAAPRLRIIARNGTGVDMIHKDTCLRRGIVVTNQPGGNAQAVAEVSRKPVNVPNFLTVGKIACINLDSYSLEESSRSQPATSGRRTSPFHLGASSRSIRQSGRIDRNGRYRIRVGQITGGKYRQSKYPILTIR